MEEADKDWMMIRMVGGCVFLLVLAHPVVPDKGLLLYLFKTLTHLLTAPGPTMGPSTCYYDIVVVGITYCMNREKCRTRCDSFSRGMYMRSRIAGSCTAHSTRYTCTRHTQHRLYTLPPQPAPLRQSNKPHTYMS